MRYIVLALALSSASGCSWLCGDVVPTQAVRDVKANTDVIFVEYLKYVDADADLHPIAKDAAHTSVQKTQDLLEEAVK
jgi:hypothetical protein